MGAFRFKKKTDYGLVMISLLSEHGDECLSAREMQEYGLPRHFVVKIAQDLIEAGIIDSKEGRGGGYYLECDPDEVSVLEVLEILEGPVSTTSCTMHERCPVEERCPHRGAMARITSEINSLLGKYTISDLGD